MSSDSLSVKYIVFYRKLAMEDEGNWRRDKKCKHQLSLMTGQHIYGLCNHNAQ